MIIGVISDTHDQMVMIRKSIDVFKSEGVGAVIHCGDFVAPFAAKLFQGLNCPFYSVFGNNDGEREGLIKTVAPFGELHNPPHLYTIGGKLFLVNHAPICEKDLDKFPQPDIIFYGHTHKPERAFIKGIPSYNPGEACAWLTGEASIGLLDVSNNEYRRVVLS